MTTAIRLVAGLTIGVALILFAVSPLCTGAEPAGAGAHGKPEAAAHGAEVSTNPLEFRKELAIWTAVVFVLLLAVLWKFAWGPIAKGLDRRERGIADQIAQAAQANQEAKALLGQYDAKLAGAKEDVRGIVDQGRREAERIGHEMIDQARQEAKAEQQRAVQEIDLATANALKDLAQRGADLAVELAGRIVRAELKPDDHAVLIEQAMTGFVEHKPSVN